MKKSGDWAIALTVVACSIALFIALAFALQGNPFDRPSRTLRAQFIDVTGVQASSLVKYAGATAGTVHRVRMLTPAERAASSDPRNAVEITIALNRQVPELNDGLTASIAADTLLADKFILLSGGDPKAPTLANDALIASIRPVTFDAILRDLDGALATLRELVGRADAGGDDGIMPRIDRLLTDLTRTVAQADTLIADGNGLVTNANGLIANADGLVESGDVLIAKTGRLIDTNTEPLTRTISQFSSAAKSLDDLARRADRLVRENEGNLNAASADARAALAELRELATSTHAFVNSLRARPQQLLWGPGRQRRGTDQP